jgi:hypothetical protein
MAEAAADYLENKSLKGVSKIHPTVSTHAVNTHRR